jgi:hypothetical protein
MAIKGPRVGGSAQRPCQCTGNEGEGPIRHRGARTAAVLYSFTGTCKHLDIDPFAYLRDILHRLPTYPADKLDDLLPDVWFAAHRSARRKTAA